MFSHAVRIENEPDTVLKVFERPQLFVSSVFVKSYVGVIYFSQTTAKF